ncbi:MAG: hypothetical protein VX252_01730 [Myxococcota bacterium]|nr:hypothetical protein [Myxococcota bacterium]
MSGPSITTRIFGLMAALLLLTSCASTPPPPTLGEADVKAAEASGDLDVLYERIEKEIQTASGEQATSLKVLRAEVGAKLAAQLKAQIHKELENTDRIGGVIPLDVIQKEEDRSLPLKTWAPTAYNQLLSELNADRTSTQTAIKQRKSELADIPEVEVENRLNLLEELTKLAGPGTPEAEGFDAQRKELISQLDQEAAAAMAAENYDEAQRLLEKVQQVRPEDSETAERLADVNTKVFERDFYRALENGDPDQGYDLLVAVAASPSFPLILPNLTPSKQAMTKFYVESGAEETRKGDIPGAYRRFEQARKIQTLLGDSSPSSPPEEAAFRQLIEAEYAEALADGRPGLAFGFLKIIESMNPTDPNLRRQLRETHEKVLQRATKRLSVSSFETPDDTDAEFGDAVSASIVQHLFGAVPNDVRIIEREQLSDIIREHSLQDSGESKAKLASADYLVQGTILEAKVDTIEKKGRKTMRVVTEKVTELNPEHATWSNLSSSKRDKMPEPPKTIEVARKEDVTVEVILHRKIGIFSVSYRVIDTDTAKVTFADSARSVAKHEDTSSEGMELGEFKLPFQLSNLPSDTEILTELADEVSGQIGAQLAEVLANPEAVYANSAERFEREANYPAAAQQYAYAIVLSDRKNKDTEEMTARLRDTSIASTRR